MKQEDFDLLSQYVDGELDTEKNVQVKQRLLSEPDFNKQYREIMSLEQNVRGVMPDFKDEPMSAELSALLAPEAEKSRSVVAANSSGWRHYLSLAASVIFVAVLGVYFINSGEQHQTGLQIQHDLFSSLQSNESWASDNGMELVIVESYLDQSNTLCREYFAKDMEHSEHGISCFVDGQWNKQVFELNFNQSDSHYVTATASEDGGVEEFLKNLNSLSAEEESQKLQSVK